MRGRRDRVLGDRRRKGIREKRSRAGGVIGGLLLSLVLGWAALAAGPDIAVTDIEFGIVAGPGSASRPTLSENQAVLGDTVRVRAVVENQGDGSAGVFNVEFYFIEKSSLETDRIGRATVFGLAPGEELKPAVTLDTSLLGPGIYEIVVKADPEGVLNEANLCNNEIPRATCGTDTAITSSPCSNSARASRMS